MQLCTQVDAQPTCVPLQESVIDTIVAKVQGVPGDDMCVLLLGYPDQMETMMREANPGLARRFQMREAWVFEDYNQEDLLDIMKNAAASRWAVAAEMAGRQTRRSHHQSDCHLLSTGMY